MVRWYCIGFEMRKMTARGQWAAIVACVRTERLRHDEENCRHVGTERLPEIDRRLLSGVSSKVI